MVHRFACVHETARRGVGQDKNLAICLSPHINPVTFDQHEYWEIYVQVIQNTTLTKELYTLSRTIEGEQIEDHTFYNVIITYVQAFCILNKNY